MTLQKSRAGILSLAVAAGIAAFCGRSVNAAIIMDQIGSNPAVVTAGSYNLSTRFQAALSADDSAVVDDFTVTGPSLLTKISAVVDGYGANFTSFSTVTGWGVEIFSSLAAASSSLTGDVYTKNFLPAAVALTTPYGGNGSAGLLSITTAITLPSAGTYYLAVIAGNASSNGFIGVYNTTNVAGSNPGDLDAAQVNPGGGLGFTNNEKALNADAAYSVSGITAVPEPATALAMAIAGGLMGLSRRKR